jgi:hypothetical protein
MPFRIPAILGLTMAWAAGSPALAQEQPKPVVIMIQGPCVLATNGHPMDCAGVSYMAFPTTHRIAFTAITDKAGWTFSGDQDHNDDGRYTLAVDSVLSPQAGAMQAQGVCAMVVAEDRRDVPSLECQARTPAGVMMMKASGRVVTGEGDNDDDDDDGPDSQQG